jgi:hypothetical protein
MKHKFILLLLSLVSPLACAQSDYSVTYQSLRSSSPLQDKTFYLFTLMEEVEQPKQLLKQEPQLQKFLKEKKRQFDYALQTCEGELSCLAGLFLISDEQTELVSEVLKTQCLEQSYLEHMVQEHLRPSGYYQQMADLSDAELLAAAWELSAEGINEIIQSYAFGQHGRYPAIDSVSYDIRSPYYQRQVHAGLERLSEDTAAMDLFFQPALRFALQLLELNNRNEAIRFEPMEAGENRAVLSYISTIKWEEFPYTLILVPGHGPEQSWVSLSPLAKIRNEMAAKRFREGLAPLIVVSGGNVHPFQTPYNEALEMKKDLMQRLQIPEYAILIEPHARHTTTNFRNTARLIFRYQIPSDKPALATTDIYQSHYITNRGLDERCREELGYVPFQHIKRLNQHDVVWLPVKDALQTNPLDPLDP